MRSLDRHGAEGEENTESMTITAIIEKGTDGMYSIRSEQHFGKNFFGGFGETVALAKEDFFESVREAFADAKAEGMEVSEDFTVDFQSDF